MVVCNKAQKDWRLKENIRNKNHEEGHIENDRLRESGKMVGNRSNEIVIRNEMIDNNQKSQL